MAQELFERVDRKVGNLLDDVINGRIGLPDLQRPFVWADAKVRNLFDSMMKGFPIGYVMLWASPADYTNTKSIGVGEKEFKRPDDLVIDGQQLILWRKISRYGHKLSSAATNTLLIYQRCLKPTTIS